MHVPRQVDSVATAARSVIGRSLTTAIPRRALSNARQAAHDIALAVAERSLLAAGRSDDRADTDDAVPAGALTLLSPQDAMSLLQSKSLGRLAYIARTGVPDIVPVNYTMDGSSIQIASGPGPKLQAALRRDVVAFEVDDVDEVDRTGWSVVVIGQARLEKRLRAPDQTDDGAAGPWASGPRNHIVRIEPRRIEGRRLH